MSKIQCSKPIGPSWKSSFSPSLQRLGTRHSLTATGLGLWSLVFGLLTLFCGACNDATVAVPGTKGALKTAAAQRAERRAYDGAPPIIAHEPLGADCSACHTMEGIAIEGLGFAPPSPHRDTVGMSAMNRCLQCHIFQKTDEQFVGSTFMGFQQDLRQGRRLYDGAPPVIPHHTLMRENCIACHSGPAAREEARTSHPERIRCLQCHVSAATQGVFAQ